MSKNENKSGKCKNCSCAQGANCNKKPEMEKKECDKLFKKLDKIGNPV